MTERFSIEFTLPQMEALVKALEECGANKSNFQRMVEVFNDTHLATAATAAHKSLRGQMLKATGRRRVGESSDYQRSAGQEARISELRNRIDRLNERGSELERGLIAVNEFVRKASTQLSNGLKPQAEHALADALELLYSLASEDDSFYDR